VIPVIPFFVKMKRIGETVETAPKVRSSSRHRGVTSPI